MGTQTQNPTPEPDDQGVTTQTGSNVDDQVAEQERAKQNQNPSR